MSVNIFCPEIETEGKRQRDRGVTNGPCQDNVYNRNGPVINSNTSSPFSPSLHPGPPIFSSWLFQIISWLNQLIQTNQLIPETYRGSVNFTNTEAVYIFVLKGSILSAATALYMPARVRDSRYKWSGFFSSIKYLVCFWMSSPMFQRKHKLICHILPSR